MVRMLIRKNRDFLENSPILNLRPSKDSSRPSKDLAVFMVLGLRITLSCIASRGIDLVDLVKNKLLRKGKKNHSLLQKLIRRNCKFHIKEIKILLGMLGLQHFTVMLSCTYEDLAAFFH